MDKEKLKKLYYTQKKSCKEIGKIYGVSKNTIARTLKKYGYNLRNSNPIPKKIDKQKVINLFDKGYTIHKIYTLLKVNKVRIRDIILKSGRVILNGATLRKKKRNECLNCKKLCKCLKSIYCSPICRGEFTYKKYIKNWKEKKVNGLNSLRNTHPYIKRYLIKKYSEKCQKCLWDKKNPVTKKVPIEVHHKDGNYKNNAEENLELICPNCHSLTNHYRGLNKGNGRTKN